MNMNQFIKVGDSTFTAEEVCRRLGIEPKNGLTISLGQYAVGGTLEASVALGDPDGYPNVDVNFHIDGEAPIPLSHSEQDVNERGEDGKPMVRTFLYDRADAYVAYIGHKICTEDELGDEVLETDLVASGDPDITVHVYRENHFVTWEGNISNKHPAEGFF